MVCATPDAFPKDDLLAILTMFGQGYGTSQLPS